MESRRSRAQIALIGLVSFGLLAWIPVSRPDALAQDPGGNLPEASASREQLEFVKTSFIFVFHDFIPGGGVPDWAHFLAFQHGAAVRHVYSTALKGFSATLAPEAAAALARNPNIAFYEQDQVFWAIGKPEGVGKPPKDPAPHPLQETPWGITRVCGTFCGPYLANNNSVPSAWVIDTGIDLDHPDLNVDAARGENFASFGKKTLDDGNGHGTHVAGIIAALNNAIDVVGVAPGAPVVPVRVLGNNGSGFLSDVIAGVDHVAGHAAPGDAANMSLGGGPSSALDTAVVNASNRGIYFTLAAGNESDDADNHSPARAEGKYIFTISAIDSNDVFAWFSNYGNPPVDYAAPGVSILSLYKGGGMATLSGTSMAAPHAAGLLLLGSVCAENVATNDPDGNADPIAQYRTNEGATCGIGH